MTEFCCSFHLFILVCLLVRILVLALLGTGQCQPRRKMRKIAAPSSSGPFRWMAPSIFDTMPLPTCTSSLEWHNIFALCVPCTRQLSDIYPRARGHHRGKTFTSLVVAAVSLARTSYLLIANAQHAARPGTSHKGVIIISPRSVWKEIDRKSQKHRTARILFDLRRAKGFERLKFCAEAAFQIVCIVKIGVLVCEE